MDKFSINKQLHILSEEEWILDGDNMRFMKQDDSGISVTSWNHKSVAPHNHDYCEFALIISGSCNHTHRGIDAQLVPGDVLLVKPGETHSYITNIPLEMINCQFRAKDLDDEGNELWESIAAMEVKSKGSLESTRRWNEIVRNMNDASEEISNKDMQRNYAMDQGVIHLSPHGMREVSELFRKMMKEQREKRSGYVGVKKACLQMILAELVREQEDRMDVGKKINDEKYHKIYETIDYIEQHFQEKIDLDQLAADNFWSPGYFRCNFKKVTGYTPLDYINRLRIVHSLEYLEREDLMVQEAARKVGIEDPAYYSRLFKKIIGYSPRFFRNSPDKL